MAVHFYSGLSLHRQTSCFPSSLPTTSTLLGRTKCRFSAPVRHRYPLRVQCAAGSKESGVQSVRIPADDEVELPPLVASLAITGFPPCQESMYADEALAGILKRWPFKWLEPHCRMLTSSVSFMHRSTVSCDRLIAISSAYTLVAFLDDVFFDLQNDVLREKCGIDHNIPGNVHSIREYLHSLDALFRQEEPLQNPTQIQEMTWKLGCDLRELSNPEWFKRFADAILDFYNSSLESHTADVGGNRTYITDLESFAQMRKRNAGSVIGTMSVEFCNNLFLPTEIREHPVVQQLTMATWTHNAYVNDIFSYSKEEYEPHSRNLINVIMESEGMLLPQAAWRAVNLANSVAHDFMELETQLTMLEEEPWTFAVRRYVEGLKEFMAGDLYWHSLQKRYRHHKAPFPELRDVNASFSPKAEHFKCV